VLRSEKCHELFNVSAGNVSGTSSGIAWLIKDKVLFAHSQSLQARGVCRGGKMGIFSLEIFVRTPMLAAAGES